MTASPWAIESLLMYDRFKDGRSGFRARRRVVLAVAIIFALLTLPACSSLTGQRGALSPAEQRNQELLHQLQEVTVRAESANAINEKLQGDQAQVERAWKKAEDELQATKKQLAELQGKFSSVENELAQSRQSIQTHQASMHRQSTVTVVPNNSWRDRQLAINAPGVSVDTDGDFIRVSIPDSRLFHSIGTWKLSVEGCNILAEVGHQLRMNFPDQEIGVEGHMNQLFVNDHRKLNAHEIGAQKAFAVAYHMISENILEEGRLRISGVGANNPIDTAGTTEAESKNTRIEFVVYPTKWR